MAFDGNEGGSISLETAADYTSNYRTNNPNGLRAHFFGSKIIEDILAQEGCKGIRIYYGEETNGTQVLVICGADGEENDMIGEGDILADLSNPCPPYTSATNDLNS